MKLNESNLSECIHLTRALGERNLRQARIQTDPDHSQNLITCSLSHLGDFLKISSKSIHNFSSYLSLKITLIQKIQIVIWITPKIESFLPFTFSDISWKFHQNPSISFWVISFTNRRTDKPRQKHNLLGGGNNNIYG